jgi:L-iditol 2-dehydrogenase
MPASTHEQVALALRVAVYYSNDDVRLEERPVPEIGPGEVLVKVWASGICGSDVMEWYRVKRAPCILGHEIGGEVTEVGEGVEAFGIGDRVFVSHHVPCNMCSYCLDDHHSVCDTLRSTNFDPGGFAEYVRIPEINVTNGTYRLPDDMGYDEAVFIEPLGCVFRGQRKAGVKPGDTVLVLGAGLTGLLHVKLAQALGAGRIIATDVLEARRMAAEETGECSTCDALGDVASYVKERNEGQLADVVIVATGAPPALEQAWDCVDRGGTILFFAPTDPEHRPPMPFNDLWKDEVTIVTSYAAAPRDITAAIELIRSGRVTVTDLITHKLPLERAQEGFRLVADPVDSIKVIIEPQQ